MISNSFPSRILVASGNAHKLVELRGIVGQVLPQIEWQLATDLGLDMQWDETGTTFEENALIKVRHLAKQTDGWVLADDSGLVVDALGGAPGVYSSRFAGVEGDAAANNRKLVEELQRLQFDTSVARFVCVLALRSPAGVETLFRGEVLGEVRSKSQGKQGFGYDPHFYPAGYQQSFAAMPSEEKDQISHRRVAANQLRAHLESLR